MKNYYKLKSLYSDKLRDKHVELERAKDMNKHIEEISAEKAEIDALLNDVKTYFQAIRELSKMVTKESNDYKERRLSFLNDKISDSLLKIFPNMGFRADITIREERNKNKAFLVLYDKYNNEILPSVQEGKMCQYLISFSAVSGVIAAHDYNNIYVDEAFGASSMDNLVRIGDIISKTCEEGMQIILVSQNPLLYENIPRREIRMHKDPILDKVIIDSVEDK